MLHPQNRWVRAPLSMLLSVLLAIRFSRRSRFLLSDLQPEPRGCRFPIHGRKEADIRKLIFGGFEDECVLSIQMPGAVDLQVCLPPRNAQIVGARILAPGAKQMCAILVSIDTAPRRTCIFLEFKFVCRERKVRPVRCSVELF